MLDLSTPEKEFEALMFPLPSVFDWGDWNNRYLISAMQAGKRDLLPNISAFYTEIMLKNFEQYQVPVISLASTTSREAVCVVFEKVNTGGKPLDAFELVTAMYAADGHELRKDWYGKGG